MKSSIVFVTLVLATASAEVVQWRPCPSVHPNATSSCTVHEVRVDPCKQAADSKPCELKRGRRAKINFDFTPNFEASSLETRAYWTTTLTDLGFRDMETDACKSTTCPVTSGTKQTYTYELPISRNYPKRAYDVKWKLWNDKKQECCFIFQIKVVK